MLLRVVFYTLRAMIFVILVPSVTGKDSVGYHSDINQAGFVSVTLLQCTADFMMFLALDHEQRFRSSGTGSLYIYMYNCVYLFVCVYVEIVDVKAPTLHIFIMHVYIYNCT